MTRGWNEPIGNEERHRHVSTEQRRPASISTAQGGDPITSRRAHEFSSQWAARRLLPSTTTRMQRRREPSSDLVFMNGAVSGPDHCTSLAQEDRGERRGRGRRGRQRPHEKREAVTMKRRQRHADLHDEDKGNKDPHPDLLPPDLPSPSSSSSSPPLPPSAMPPSPSASALAAPASPATRRSISMGDFRRVTGALLSGPPSASATAPSSRLVTPSSSMEFEAARRRLLEVEERQRVIREMERRLEELREVFVRSEEEAVVHGEVASRISSAAQQGELSVGENSQRLKKGLKFKKHRPAIVFSSMLGLRTCLPWPVKLK